MGFWSLVLAFAPWVSFKIIIKLPFFDSITMLKIGLVVAAIICFYQGWTGLHRGFLLYGGVVFFAFGVVTVVLMDNRWVMQHLAVISHATLSGFTWMSILLKRPFTMEYAKQSVDSKYWDTPVFIRKNNLITGVWALAFTVSLIDATLHLTLFPQSGAIFEIIDDLALVAAALFTTRYSKKPASAVTAG